MFFLVLAWAPLVWPVALIAHRRYATQMPHVWVVRYLGGVFPDGLSTTVRPPPPGDVNRERAMTT